PYDFWPSEVAQSKQPELLLGWSETIKKGESHCRSWFLSARPTPERIPLINVKIITGGKDAHEFQAGACR
ncbi:MAG: hypothetical protein ACK6AD_09260, partial [Cyanobacteriota bacterium]